MAQAIAQAMRDNSLLVAEAGTGTGKTFAYLVPALLSGGKVIISTGTKTLQDQLFNRDLPTVRDALKVPVSDRAAQGPRQLRLPLPPGARRSPKAALPAAKTCAHLHKIARFAKTSDTGDKCGTGRGARERRRLAVGDVHARELPRPGLPHYKDCFVHGGAARGAGGRRGGGQPSSVLRRRDAARRRRGRTAAGLQHGDLRRGAPAAGNGEPVLRREPVAPASCSTWRAMPRPKRSPAAKDCPPCRTAARRAGESGRDLRLAFGMEARAPCPCSARWNATASGRRSTRCWTS